MKTRRFVVPVVVAVVIALLWALVSVVRSGSSANLPDGLFGIPFVLQSSIGFRLAEGTTMTLSFSDDSELLINPQTSDDVFSVRFNADCNKFFGDFRMGDEGLEPTRWNLLTDMGCELSRHEQDDWLGGFLMDGPRVSVSGDNLTLRGETATLFFMAQPVVESDRPVVK